MTNKVPGTTIVSFTALAVLVAGCARYQPPAQRVVVSNVNALRSSFAGGVTEATAAAGPAAEPTGWATIKGSFKIAGTPPARQPVNVDKDQNVCAPGGKQVLNEALVVDSSGGIKDVVIYLVLPGRRKFPVGDPKWEHPDYASQRDATLDFDQKNCVFLSHLFAMRTSQKLRILNSDPVGHNTKIDASGNTSSINATIPAGSAVPYQPGGESPDPFPVSCSIHTWMRANMIVRDSPYFAVSKPDGSFEMANIPAGVPLEFRVWQEKAGFVPKATVNGAAATWPKGTIKLTLQPGDQKPFDVAIDASVFSK